RHKRLAVALQPAPQRVARGRAPTLVGLVGGHVHPMVLLQTPDRLEQPILPVTRDRLCLALAVLLELAPRNPEPLKPPGLTSNRPLRIHLRRLRALTVPADRAALALLDPPLGLRKRLSPTLRSAQLLGQL